MNRGRRPGISGIGRVTDDGHTIVISGWALTWCAARCPCHGPQLRIADDQGAGHLGLATGNRHCGCCRPWTADELAAVIRDLADITALQGTT